MALKNSPKNCIPKGQIMTALAVEFLIIETQGKSIMQLVERYGDITVYEVARYCQMYGLIENEKRVNFTLSYKKELFITKHGTGGSMVTTKGVEFINSHLEIYHQYL